MNNQYNIQSVSDTIFEIERMGDTYEGKGYIKIGDDTRAKIHSLLSFLPKTTEDYFYEANCTFVT